MDNSSDKDNALKMAIVKEANYPKDTSMAFIDSSTTTFTFVGPNRDLTQQEYKACERTFSQAIEKLEATYDCSTNCESRVYSVTVQCIPFAKDVTGFQLWSSSDPDPNPSNKTESINLDSEASDSDDSDYDSRKGDSEDTDESETSDDTEDMEDVDDIDIDVPKSNRVVSITGFHREESDFCHLVPDKEASEVIITMPDSDTDGMSSSIELKPTPCDDGGERSPKRVKLE